MYRKASPRTIRRRISYEQPSTRRGSGHRAGRSPYRPTPESRARPFALALAPPFLFFAKGLVQVGRGHRERVELGQIGLKRRIVDPFGVQLQIDVPRQPHLLDAFHVAGTRAVTESVEDVDDFLVFGQRRTVGQNHAGNKDCQNCDTCDHNRFNTANMPESRDELKFFDCRSRIFPARLPA